jgi:hypothetical protein
MPIGATRIVAQRQPREGMPLDTTRAISRNAVHITTAEIR